MDNNLKSKQFHFDFDRFEALDESELCEYMEPIAWSVNSTVDPNDLRRMAEKLTCYDMYHLVYAIELGVDHKPELFARLIPPLLSHSEQSVRLAASRTLNRLPDNVVTRNLLESVLTHLESCPESEHMKDIPKRLKAILGT